MLRRTRLDEIDVKLHQTIKQHHHGHDVSPVVIQNGLDPAIFAARHVVVISLGNLSSRNISRRALESQKTPFDSSKSTVRQLALPTSTHKDQQVQMTVTGRQGDPMSKSSISQSRVIETATVETDPGRGSGEYLNGLTQHRAFGGRISRHKEIEAQLRFRPLRRRRVEAHLWIKSEDPDQEDRHVAEPKGLNIQKSRPPIARATVAKNSRVKIHSEEIHRKAFPCSTEPLHTMLHPTRKGWRLSTVKTIMSL